MKRSDELRAKIADLTDEAEALVNRAEREGRDLNEAEQKRWTALMAKDSGEIAKLQTELQAAITKEEETYRLRTLKAMNSATLEPIWDRTGAKPFTGSQPQVRTATLQAFKAGTRQEAERDCYDVGLWLKSTLLNDLEAREKLQSRRGPSWVASMSESSPTSGGYLVPAPLEAAIIASREQIGAIRQLASVYPMTSDSLAIPKRTSGVTVYPVGEESEITTSDVAFGRITLEPRKRAVLSYISSELRDDAIIPVTDFLATEFGHALGLQEDRDGIVGDGGSTYGHVTGVKTAVVAATASVYTPTADEDAWDELSLASHLATMSLLADQYRVPGQLQWLCSMPYKWQVLDRLSLAMGGSAVNDIVNGQGQAMFLGYPVVLSDRMPTATAVSQVSCLFGNFKRAVVMGERIGIRVALSEHYRFANDQISVRGVVRYDINCHQCGDTVTAGAVVGLSTHS